MIRADGNAEFSAPLPAVGMLSSLGSDGSQPLPSASPVTVLRHSRETGSSPSGSDAPEVSRQFPMSLAHRIVTRSSSSAPFGSGLPPLLRIWPNARYLAPLGCLRGVLIHTGEVLLSLVPL